MDILIILALIYFGFVLGELFTSFKFVRILKKMAEDEGIDIEKELEKRKNVAEEMVNQIARLEVEEHNSVLYLYHRESREFVCQGKTLEELATLAKQYKNIAGAVVLHNDKVFMFMNGTAKEYTQ